jgi:hypothetical protein
VARHKDTGSWQANIACNGKQQHLGLFKTAEEAAKAYDAAALRLHGEFAKTNAMLAEEARPKPFLTGENNYRTYNPVPRHLREYLP